jgi:hypothetical protein
VEKENYCEYKKGLGNAHPAIVLEETAAAIFSVQSVFLAPEAGSSRFLQNFDTCLAYYIFAISKKTEIMNFTTMRISDLKSEEADLSHQLLSYFGYTLKLVGTSSMHGGRGEMHTEF